MREALAEMDHDFLRVSPVDKRAKRARAAAKPKATARKWPMLSFFSRRPATIVLSAAASALVVGICINALVLQKARHQAPFFATARTVAPPEKPTQTPAGAPAQRVTASPSSVATPVAAPAPRGRDPIAQLLKGGTVPTPPVRDTAQPAAPEPSRQVAQSQKALMKLGFVIKPDGVAGTTTKSAIERFEKDRGMPVKGELTTKIQRILSSESGVPLD